MEPTLSETSLFTWNVDDGPGPQVVVMSGLVGEWIVMLRFVDIMSRLEPAAMGRMHIVVCGGDYVSLTIGASGNNGEPLPLDYAERVGKRMAKVLWNLGGPPYVWLTDEFDHYRFDWIDPAAEWKAMPGVAA